MVGHSVLVLALLAQQDAKKAELDAARQRRAAIVDRVMVEPQAVRQLDVNIVVQVPAAQQPITVIRSQLNGKRLILESRPATPPDDGEDGADDRPPMRMMPINLRELSLASNNFDRWVFGDQTGEEEEAQRLHLSSLLSRRIAALEKSGEADPARAEKLLLAGRGDIKRFFDRVAESRAEFEVARKDYTAGRVALGQLEPLASEFREGPFGAGSFFEKALKRSRKGAGDTRGAGK